MPGLRKDGLNLIEHARDLGYEVVYTREDLFALPPETSKVLGVNEKTAPPAMAGPQPFIPEGGFKRLSRIIRWSLLPEPDLLLPRPRLRSLPARPCRSAGSASRRNWYRRIR